MKLLLKFSLIIMLIFVSATLSYATTISGTVTNNNTALSNGSLTMQLFGCVNPLVNSSGGPSAKTLYSFTLDSNGNLPTAAITGNDVIYCSGVLGTTYYELKAYNYANGLIWDRYYRITGSVWNLNSATVLTNFGISTYLLVNPPGDQVVTTPLTNRLTFAGGTTLIQQLQLGRDPINLNDAATKNYVDNSISNVSSTVANVTGKVNRSGDTMTGPFYLAADPINPLQAATKQYVDSHSNTYTLTGASSGGSAPNATYNGSAPITFDYHTLGAVGLSPSANALQRVVGPFASQYIWLDYDESSSTTVPGEISSNVGMNIRSAPGSGGQIGAAGATQGTTYALEWDSVNNVFAHQTQWYPFTGDTTDDQLITYTSSPPPYGSGTEATRITNNGTLVYGPSAIPYCTTATCTPASSVNNVTCASSITLSPTATVNYIPLSCNISTTTLASGAVGASIHLQIKQTGGYPFPWPSNVHGTFTVGLVAGSYTNADLRWDSTDNVWLVSNAVIN